VAELDCPDALREIEMNGEPTVRIACIPGVTMLLILVGCTHSDQPNCLMRESGKKQHTSIESSAIEDARRREGSCGNKTTRCDFDAESLSSGEILVSVEHTYLDETSSKCGVIPDTDHHYLYSASGEFKRRLPGP